MDKPTSTWLWLTLLYPKASTSLSSQSLGTGYQLTLLSVALCLLTTRSLTSRELEMRIPILGVVGSSFFTAQPCVSARFLSLQLRLRLRRSLLRCHHLEALLQSWKFTVQGHRHRHSPSSKNLRRCWNSLHYTTLSSLSRETSTIILKTLLYQLQFNSKP